MKGTPVGNHRRRRATRAGVGSAVAALALAASGQQASADTLAVTKKGAQGKGSFVEAVKRANESREADTIVFARDLRGKVRLPGRGVGIQGELVIQGRGYGKSGAKRFKRVRLKGPKGGAVLEVKRDGHLSARELYLDRAFLSAEQAAGLTVRDSYLTGQDTVNRPGIYHGYGYGSQLKVLDTTVTEFKQGIDTYRTSGRIERSTITSNEGRGGVQAGSYTHLRVSKSTISGNVISPTPAGHRADGGGLTTVYYGSMEVVNSTITGNSAEGPGSRGGGVYGEVDVQNSTIADNSAEIGGGLFGSVDYEDAHLANSILFGNESTGAGGEDCAGTVISGGGNLVGSPGDCALVGTDLAGVDPNLSKLADNGGPTRTMAIPKGSPADGLAVKKTATDFDQRGVKRGKNPDAGAYERKG